MYDENFDSQKLMYHPERVSEWLKTGLTKGPLYTEFELTSSCNCKCIFCGVDYCVNKPRGPIPYKTAIKILKELKNCGNKSIMIAGHGESLLHPDAKKIINASAKLMSTSVTTNGITLDDNLIEIIDNLKWVRFSINGTDKNNYKKIHGNDNFDRVIENIQNAVKRKKDKKLKVTIGSQIVLLNENINNIDKLTSLLKNSGLDYFSIKPYSKHPKSKNNLNPDYSNIHSLKRQLKKYENEKFKIIFRIESFNKINAPKTYQNCHGTHFISFVDALANVWECNIYAEDKRFYIGNASQDSIKNIWKSKQRKSVLNFIQNKMDLNECRDLCRMEACNVFLNRLKNPLDHDDFI
jgi:MoaA/NifB/PqqE/SkfB family radical SAM enzyme